jgi:hypothetical protein
MAQGFLNRHSCEIGCVANAIFFVFLPFPNPTTTLFPAQSSSCDESNKPHDFSSESTLLAEELIRDLFPGLGAAPE